MQIDVITLGLLLIVTGLAGVVLALILAYQKVFKELQILSKSQRRSQDKSFHQAEAVLDDARQEALSTIQQANQKATHLIKLGGKFAEEQKTELAKKLKETSSQEFDTYKETLQKSQFQLLDVMGEVTDELQRTSETELTHFRQELVKATAETQQLFVTQLQRELAETTDDVSHYKQQLINRATAQMYDVIETIVKNVLHKTLTRTEHEALVIEALEEAKKNHVI